MTNRNELKLHKAESDIWISEGCVIGEAMARTTHLAIGAHQDDLEIMAYEGIAHCYETEDRWFSGIVATDGRGSSRVGPYADLSDEQMRTIRREEQRKAAAMGKFGLQIQLDYTSSELKGAGKEHAIEDLVRILMAMKPEVVYLHHPADKHDSHVALLVCCIEALRRVAPVYIPARVLGCEVWRNLDWLPDSEKVAMDCSAYPELAEALLSVFDSQISGGKAYDKATLGRRFANATFNNSHGSDSCTSIAWALDLKPLIEDSSLAICTFIQSKIDLLSADVAHRLGTCNL